MAVSDEYIRYVCDQLGGFDAVTAKRMFGGAGLYGDGVMFGLIADDILYFKVDDSNRADYEALGCGPFRPNPNGMGAMPYYEVPVDTVEDRDVLVAWARKARAVALRAQSDVKKKLHPKKRR